MVSYKKNELFNLREHMSSQPLVGEVCVAHHFSSPPLFGEVRVAHHFSSPPLFGEVRVAHHFSFLCLSLFFVS